MSPIPPRGSIPRRKPRGRAGSDAGLGDLLGGLLKGLGKTIEGVQNLNLDDLKKLAEAQGNEEAKEKLKTLKEALGKEGIDLSKLVKIQSGVGGHILGKRFGGGLPLERGGKPQETKFDIRGTRSKRTSGPKTSPKEIREIEIDPVEEDEQSFKVRGYMAGVDEKDVVCEVKEDGTVLRVSADGERRYEKEIKLPARVSKQVKWNYRNGALEVILQKAISKGE